MREILFRGKRTDNGEWIEGYYHYANDGHNVELHLISDKITGIFTEVIPETVGQYTGLTTNGAKIFEGDIVCHDFGEKQIGKQYAIVKWRKKYASFQLEPTDDWMFCNFSDVKVIGNIYDNPELLKEKCSKYEM